MKWGTVQTILIISNIRVCLGSGIVLICNEMWLCTTVPKIQRITTDGTKDDSVLIVTILLPLDMLGVGWGGTFPIVIISFSIWSYFYIT